MLKTSTLFPCYRPEDVHDHLRRHRGVRSKQIGQGNVYVGSSMTGPSWIWGAEPPHSTEDGWLCVIVACTTNTVAYAFTL